MTTKYKNTSTASIINKPIVKKGCFVRKCEKKKLVVFLEGATRRIRYKIDGALKGTMKQKGRIVHMPNDKKRLFMTQRDLIQRDCRNNFIQFTPDLKQRKLGSESDSSRRYLTKTRKS